VTPRFGLGGIIRHRGERERGVVLIFDGMEIRKEEGVVQPKSRIFVVYCILERKKASAKAGYLYVLDQMVQR